MKTAKTTQTNVTTTIENISAIQDIKKGVYIKIKKGGRVIDGRVYRCFRHNILNREEIAIKTKDGKLMYVTEATFKNIKQVGMRIL